VGAVEPGVKVLTALAAIANGVWHVYPWFSGSSPKKEAASKKMVPKEKGAYPIPDLPSIAVLPFANLSGDPTQPLRFAHFLFYVGRRL